METLIPWVLAIAFTVFGGLFFAVSLREYLEQREAARTRVRTRGTVVRHVASDGDSATLYSIVVRFATADGRMVEVENSFASTMPTAIGATVDVWFDPACPERATIGSAIPRSTTCGGCLTFTFFVIGLVMLTAMIRSCR